MLLCAAIVTMCYYALLCDNLLLYVTMCCYARLSVSMCENVWYVTVFLCGIMCCDLLLCVTIRVAIWTTCYYVLLCDNLLLFETMRCYCDYVLLCDNVLLFVTMCCYA